MVLSFIYTYGFAALLVSHMLNWVSIDEHDFINFIIT
uniref:Uncharacterized protein n=1 Tax=Arundo donax TaxID=35708 RepID=A0A0A9HYT9_ARUDO